METLQEQWASPICVAAGPLCLDYTATVDAGERASQRRGVTLLLHAALARGLPTILTCKGGAAAEADLAKIALAALSEAPPPASPPPPPVQGNAPARAYRPCTPLLCHDAGGLWEQLHRRWPGSAFAVLDGSM